MDIEQPQQGYAGFGAQPQSGWAVAQAQQVSAYQQWQAQPEWMKGDLAIPDAEIANYGKLDEDRIELELYKKAAISVITALTAEQNKNVLLPLEMRSRGPVDAASEAIFNANQAEIVLLDMSNIVKACTDEATMRCLSNLAVKLSPGGEGTSDSDDAATKKTKRKKGESGSSGGPKLRPFFETSPATTQCNNTVGGINIGTTRCWICGDVITTQEEEHPLRPECEHVFPVAQAMCFTGLYESALFAELSSEKASIGAGYVDGLGKEYGWAHRVCNQIKNDKHFIEIGKDASNNATFQTSELKIAELLDQILNTPKFGGHSEPSGGVAIRKLLKLDRVQGGDGQTTWIRARIPQIKVRVDAILNRVTQLGMTVEEHVKSTIMNMRAYIARSPKCVLTIEQDIKPQILVGTGQHITLESSAGDISKRQSIIAFFVNLLGDVITDTVSKLLPKAASGADTPTNVARLLKLKAAALDLGRILLTSINNKITDDFVLTVRLKVANHLIAALKSGSGLAIPKQEYVRRLPQQLCTPDDEGKDEDDRPDYCERGAAGMQTIPLNSPKVFWSYYLQWNLGTLREIIRQEIGGMIPEYIAKLKEWWNTNLQSAHARGVSLNAFSFEVFEQHITSRAVTEFQLRAPGPNTFPGTTYDAIAAQPIVYDQAHIQSEQLFSWFGARRTRKTRKRKSKKRKTYRKKKLF